MALSNGMSSTTFRCSRGLLRSLDYFAANCEGHVTRTQAIIYCINQFLAQPEIVDTMDVRVLREPVSDMITLPISKGILAKLKEISTENHISFSALMRNIIYLGTKGMSDNESFE